MRKKLKDEYEAREKKEIDDLNKKKNKYDSDHRLYLAEMNKAIKDKQDASNIVYEAENKIKTAKTELDDAFRNYKTIEEPLTKKYKDDWNNLCTKYKNEKTPDFPCTKIS